MPRRTLLKTGLALLFGAFLLRALAVSGLAWGEPMWAVLIVAPTSLHVAAMSLVSVSLSRPRPYLALLACGSWAGASMLLECFEHEAVAAWAIRHAPLWLLIATREITSWRQLGLTRGFHLAEVLAPLPGGFLAFLFLRSRPASRTLTFGGNP
jgi:hypothetical protein